MTKKEKKGIIAVDADGVMLDYNSAYKEVYMQGFGIDLALVDKNAFHAHNMWSQEQINAKQKSDFYKMSHVLRIWKRMKALEGAVVAINNLVDSGYEIVCVTSMPAQYEADRLHNLQALGFKINRVIATSRKGKGNPKKSYIESLCPLYFVDDLIKNFEGIESSAQLVYIDRKYSDNPNVDQGHIPYHQTFSSLKEFSDMVLQKNLEEENKLKLGVGVNSSVENKIKL